MNLLQLPEVADFRQLCRHLLSLSDFLTDPTRYWTVDDHRPVVPDSKPSAKNAEERSEIS